MLIPPQRDDWTNHGLLELNGFVERPVAAELLCGAEAMADRVDAGGSIGNA